jgi:hypothetical protein
MDIVYLLVGAGFFLLCWALAAYSGKLMEQ